MLALSLALAALLFIFTGWVTLCAIGGNAKRGLAEIAGLSIGLGLGIVPLLEFYANSAGFALDFGVTLAIAALFLATAICVKPKLRLGMPSFKFGDARGALLVMLILIVAAALILSFSHAQISGDGVAIWGLKAKILFSEHTVLNDRFFDPDALHPHKYYPLLFPLDEMIVYQFLGHISETFSASLIYSLLMISGILVFDSLSRRIAPVNAARSFTLLFALSSAYALSCFGYADYVLAFFILAAVLMQWSWLKSGNDVDLLLAAIFCSFAIFTKNEGLPIVFAVCGAFALHNWRRLGIAGAARPSVVVLGVALLISLPWLAMRAALPDDDAFRAGINQNMLQDMPQGMNMIIVRAIKIGILEFLPFSVLFAILLFSLAGAWMKIGDSAFLLLVLVLWGCLVLSFYLITPYDLDWHLASSLNRLFFQATGVFTFAVLAVSAEAGVWQKR